jgi:hypothetical protein
MATLTELLRGVEERIARRMVVYGHHIYRVQLETNRVGDPPSGVLTLQSVGSVAGLPDMVEIEKAHGLAGAREQCQPGSLVLVGFRNGQLGLPYVSAYLPSIPISITLDASQLIKLGEGAHLGVARETDSVDCGTITVVTNVNPDPPGVKISYTPPGGGAPTAIFRLDGAITLTPVTPPGSATIALSGAISTASAKVVAE